MLIFFQTGALSVLMNKLLKVNNLMLSDFYFLLVAVDNLVKTFY